MNDSKLLHPILCIHYIYEFHDYSHHDYSLFYRKSGSQTVFVAMYVDDVILTRIDTDEITQFKTYLDSIFNIKGLGKLHYFLGPKILDTIGGVLVS